MEPVWKLPGHVPPEEGVGVHVPAVGVAATSPPVVAVSCARVVVG